MTTRRNFLAGAAGAAASAGMAGCLGFFDDPLPGQGVETDDELLRAVADPSSQVPPLFFSAYQYQLDEVEEKLDLPETIPRAGGAIAGLFDDQLGEIGLSALDRITGSIYNSSASGGNLQLQPLPSGQAVHATGEFAAESLIDVVEASEAHRPLGEFEGYDRYFASIGEGDGFEAWAIRNGRLIVVNRTDVTSRSSQYDNPEDTARDALAIEFDHLDRDDAPIVTAAPAFAETVQQLESGPIRAGTGYALIPKGSDIGTAAFDNAVTGVVGAGLRGTVGDEPTLQRAVTYLDQEMATQETIQAAYDASESEEIVTDAWEFSTADATITARASLSELPAAEMFQTVLPVPGHHSLFSRVNPAKLNREPTPRAFFQPSVVDGELQIVHISGVEIEDLQVRYVHDGEIQRESWDGPVAEEDEFTSSKTIDSGTQSWITWRPETVDAAVLARFETPA